MNNQNRIMVYIQKNDDSGKINSKKPAYEHEILGLSIYEYVKNAVTDAGLELINENGRRPSERLLILDANLPYLSGQNILDFISFHESAGALYSSSESGSAAIIDAGKIIFKDGENERPEIRYEGLFKKVFRGSGKGFVPVSSIKDIVTAQKYIQKSVNEALMDSGVMITDPDTSYIAPGAKIGKDTVISPNTFILGNTVIGEDCQIGHGSYILDMEIGNEVVIQCSVLKKSKIGNKTVVGPFAYIRPDCEIGESVKIGDFVEVKNSKIGNNTKASHLTYIGDSDLGEKINLGCGVVTVNYDGKKKGRTVIKDNVFVGCNSNLIAPVEIEEGSYIAAGSTITDNVPKENLGIARARQVNKAGWSLK